MEQGNRFGPTSREVQAPSYQFQAGLKIHPFGKVALYIAGYFGLAIILSVVLAVAAGIFFGMGLAEPPEIDAAFALTDLSEIDELVELIAPYLLPIVLATGLYTIAYTWAFLRIVDRRPLTSLGLRLVPGWRGDFAKGVGLAALILAIVYAFSLAAGSIRVEGFARPAPESSSVLLYLLGALGGFLVVGLYEELMFRGYVLQRLCEGARRPAAIAVSSVLFALLHGFNPGANAFGIFNTTIIGILLAALYFRSGSLWMPVGFHFGWNFFLGYVYSLPVSGLPIYGILKVVEVEPQSRMTGGSYGPEAGLAATIVLAAWGAWLIWKQTGGRTGQQRHE